MKKIIALGLIVIVVLASAYYIFWRNPSGSNYVGTYIIEDDNSTNSSYPVVLTIRPDGTGNSFMNMSHLPYKGEFTWTHSFDDGYSFLECTWENPETEDIRYGNLHLEYPNTMTFTLTGIGIFKDATPGILLTPVKDEYGNPIMGEVGKKVSDEPYNIDDAKANYKVMQNRE